MLHYKHFSKFEFEHELSKYSYYEYDINCYNSDYLIKEGKGEVFLVTEEIQEYCYIIPIGINRCIKVYSSVDRKGHNMDYARERGGDSIKLVAADTETLKPIHTRYQHIYREGEWKKRLHERIGLILKSLGNRMTCPKCGAPQKMRGASGKNFLGCSNFPACRGRSRILYSV